MIEKNQPNLDVPTGLLLSATEDGRHLLCFFVNDDGSKVWTLHRRNFAYGADGFSDVFDVPHILAKTQTLHAHHRSAMEAALDVFACFCGESFQRLGYASPKPSSTEELYPDGFWYKNGKDGGTSLDEEGLMTRLNIVARNSFLFQFEDVPLHGGKKIFSHTPLTSQFVWMSLLPEWLPAWQGIWQTLSRDDYYVFKEEFEALRNASDSTDMEKNQPDPWLLDYARIWADVTGDECGYEQNRYPLQTFRNTQREIRYSRRPMVKDAYLRFSAAVLARFLEQHRIESDLQKRFGFSVYTRGWPETTLEPEAFTYICGQ